MKRTVTMPYLPIDQVQPGHYLGHTIYNERGSVLLHRGIVLSASYINKLRYRGYQSLYVLNDMDDEIQMPDIVSPRVRRQAINLLQSTFANINNGQSPTDWRSTSEGMDDTVGYILDEIQFQENLMADLINLKCVSSYTLEHSINVGVLSGYLGIQYGLNMKQVRELIKAGIYHDIGKTFVRTDILEKPASLTKDELTEIRTHPHKGFQLLMNQLLMSPLVSVGSQLHHERWDGNGYPKGMKGEEIHIYGRIVAAIDVYDAMTSDRVYRRAKPPHKALQYLKSQAGMQFDPRVISVLLASMFPYARGTVVELSSGEKGVVAENDPGAPEFPKVKIIKPDGSAAEIYDLKQMWPEVTITRVVL